MTTMSDTGFRVPRAATWILAMTMAGLGACGGGRTAQTSSASTAAVERGDLRITAEATGSVEPVRQVEVKSKASGEVLKLHVDVGDEVQPGTLLAEVDPRDVRNAYEQAQADLATAQERRRIAAAQLERQQELANAGVITEQELETARLDDANAEASLIKSQTNLELAELRLNDVTIRAPLAGTILTRSVEEGTVIQSASQNVSGGTVLFLMANLDSMQVRTLVDETDMGELRAGMDATVTVEAYPERTFEGRVERIEPQAVVQQNVTMFPVIVRLDNRSGLLKPGMNAEVEILIDEASDILLVPNNAIVNLSDVGPAAMVLGLNVDNLDLTAFRQTGRFGGRMPGSEGGDPPAGRSGGREGGSGRGAATGQNGGGGDAQARLASLRERAQRGEIPQDSMRALLQGMRQGGGGRRGGGGRGAASGNARLTRRAVLFVLRDSLAKPEPTVVEIGLNDWDRTQVLSGVEEGSRVALIGAAQLQAQQQEFLDRMRSRGGNSPFGGGGGPGGGGRGRGR